MNTSIDYKTLRSKIREKSDREIVAELLHSLGVEIRNDFRFKENDSFSINKNGYIKDFGSTGFSGDFVSFMIDVLGFTPQEAIEWTSVALGMDYE